ncbi:uncharacterized protein LOC125249282 isoform X3 [Megalobrama amblycephala]|uniref:uncharacterized protein LOC125249282 isoform X3 n=1 Tax=Megalobrama amblycephala TaxID=75352 RepID=UPI00201471A1|nr:uncharacterized protein LOC125249282 isoform X3 [Megalobrama amblycephala]
MIVTVDLLPKTTTGAFVLHNVSGSSCGSCSSDVVHSEACSQTQNTVPLWIVAIVLPVILILLILVLCIVLRRQGKLCEGEKKSHVYLMPPSKQHGTDNLAFSLGPADESHRNVSNEASKQPDLIKPRDSTQGVESCTESGPSCHVSGFGGSELEYYEIDSTYSDVKTPQLKKEDERGDQTTPRADFHQWQRQSQLFFKRKLAPDLTGPPQHLSADEVEKLNAPRDHKGYPHHNFRECPIKPCRSGATETSSESESHCSFTGSEFDCERELSLISSQDKDEHPPEAADRSRGQFILTAPSPFKDVVTSPSVHSLHNISVSGGIQQLENILNLGIHFNTYADVFEDIASLPTNQLTDCDFHSDQEEII